jgi:zinc protease
LHKEVYPGIAYEYELYKRYLPLITVDEVNRMNDIYFKKNINRVVTCAAPEKESVRVPDEKELREAFYHVESSQLAAYNDKAADEPLMAVKPVPGRVVRKIVHSSIGVSELQLSNGIKVVLKPTDFKNDEILFSATSPGGSSLSSDDDYFSAEQAAQVVSLGGAGKFDVITLQKMLAGKTASCNPSISQLQEGTWRRCSSSSGSTPPRRAKIPPPAKAI